MLSAPGSFQMRTVNAQYPRVGQPCGQSVSEGDTTYRACPSEFAAPRADGDSPENDTPPDDRGAPEPASTGSSHRQRLIVPSLIWLNAREKSPQSAPLAGNSRRIGIRTTVPAIAADTEQRDIHRLTDQPRLMKREASGVLSLHFRTPPRLTRAPAFRRLNLLRPIFAIGRLLHIRLTDQTIRALTIEMHELVRLEPVAELTVPEPAEEITSVVL